MGKWLFVLAFFLGLAAVVRAALRATRDSSSVGPERKDGRAETAGLSSSAPSEGASFWEVATVRVFRAPFQIEYEDAYGEATERIVDIRQVGWNDEVTMFRGWCRLRSGTRTFRADRVLSAIDLSTGEVVDDFERWLRERVGANLAEEDDEVSRLYPVMKVLCYVGKADGQLRKAEREIIAAEVPMLVGVKEMQGIDIHSLVHESGSPSEQSFVRALAALRDLGVSLDEVLACAERIVATQKAVHPNEQAALAALRKAASAQSSLAAGSVS